MTHRFPCLRAAAFLAVAAAAQACGGPSTPPAAGEYLGYVPDLAGARIMVYPVQSPPSLPGDADAELVFALENRAPDVEWVMPTELRRAAAGSPGYDVVVDALPVGMFERAEVRRVGDPLYGNIRRLAALVDADAALIPVAVRYRTAPAVDSAGAVSEATSAVPHPGRAEVTVALIAVVTGRVIWSGIVGGAPGSPSDPSVLASAMDALGRAMGPFADR